MKAIVGLGHTHTALSWTQRILHLCFLSPLHIKALPRLPTLLLFPECARVIHLYFLNVFHDTSYTFLYSECESLGADTFRCAFIDVRNDESVPEMFDALPDVT